MPRLTRRVSIALTTAALSAALVISLPAAAGAHTPAASATCSTLTVSLASYSATGNSVTVTIDNAASVTDRFGSAFGRDYPLGDSTKPHAWRVAIDASDNAYDRTITGSSTACAPALPKDAAAAARITIPSCTAAGTLVLEGLANATWSSTRAVTGPARYSVTATAATGHLFDDGKPTRVFTGTVPGALPTTDAACAAPPLPPRPEPAVTTADREAVNCAAKTITTTTTTTTTGWVLDGRTWVSATPLVATTTATRAADAATCPAAVVPPAVITTTEVGSLAHTGTDATMPLVGAGVLVAIGGILMIVRRRWTRV